MPSPFSFNLINWVFQTGDFIVRDFLLCSKFMASSATSFFSGGRRKKYDVSWQRDSNQSISDFVSIWNFISYMAARWHCLRGSDIFRMSFTTVNSECSVHQVLNFSRQLSTLFFLERHSKLSARVDHRIVRLKLWYSLEIGY